ncbi:AraC family transcriptional regulator [Paenibacillus marchantiophytorum]|uniref:AraC family transcriptional regulator n=1 Tax=Paenibacillus marchantiophytorum TaxID=1619310 RepID=A0ABQ2BT23_9BACL|nr:response regulator [Paenibacillus marchantiophytorum]GGI45606.1 AraC family transcriptional regulator [Paenibacillus marchantiophytorum]
MLKILIVDDEALVRIGIKTILPWEELGFELVGEAENGKKALEMARAYSPDIILTDIKMPVMTGIELIKQLRQENHPAKFIVLSAYDDLVYVKEAMKHGAEDYMLKLELEPVQLIQIMKELSLSIAAAKDRIGNAAIAQEYPIIHTALHKEKFFKDMLLGVIQNSAEMLQQVNRLNLNFLEKNLSCLIVEVDDLTIYDKYGEAPHLLDYSILNILEEVLSSYAYGHVASIHPKQFVAIFTFKKNEREDSGERLHELTTNMRTSLRKYLNASVCMGISNDHPNYIYIKQAFNEAKEAINYKFILPRGSDIYYCDMKRMSIQENEDISAEMRKVEFALLDGDIKAIKDALDLFIQKMHQSNNLTKELLTGLCYSIYYLFQTFMEKFKLTGKNIVNKEMYTDINTMNLKVDFIEWIHHLKQRFTEQLIDNNENMRVFTTKQFINKHYKEDLSLERIAEYLQLSTAYLSNLYKKETGQNLIEYMTEVRISQAKFLLKTTDLKIAEIAREVGYSDEYYFSKVFKKNVGESPIKYKNLSTPEKI